MAAGNAKAAPQLMNLAVGHRHFPSLDEELALSA
jgi:hypothetical protein